MPGLSSGTTIRSHILYLEQVSIRIPYRLLYRQWHPKASYCRRGIYWASNTTQMIRRACYAAASDPAYIGTANKY